MGLTFSSSVLFANCVNEAKKGLYTWQYNSGELTEKNIKQAKKEGFVILQETNTISWENAVKGKARELFDMAFAVSNINNRIETAARNGQYYIEENTKYAYIYRNQGFYYKNNKISWEYPYKNESWRVYNITIDAIKINAIEQLHVWESEYPSDLDFTKVDSRRIIELRDEIEKCIIHAKKGNFELCLSKDFGYEFSKLGFECIFEPSYYGSCPKYFYANWKKSDKGIAKYCNDLMNKTKVYSSQTAVEKIKQKIKNATSDHLLRGSFTQEDWNKAIKQLGVIAQWVSSDTIKLSFPCGIPPPPYYDPITP